MLKCFHTQTFPGVGKVGVQQPTCIYIYIFIYLIIYLFVCVCMCAYIFFSCYTYL